MPNSTNQPSTSASPPPPDMPTEDDLRVNIAVEVLDDDDEAGEPTATEQLSEETPAPVSNGNTAASAVVPVDELPTQPPPPKERVEPETMPDPRERVSKRRSFRLQIRFTKTILFAANIFIRVLYWQWFVKRFRGEAFVQRNNVRRWKQYAREFRDFAADTGGVMIKLGQFISTRADIFPEEIISELAGLQDEVPTIPFKKIREVVVEEIGDIDSVYKSLREEPIAAASLGQVHKAQLHNGDRVVVKVQRPGIADVIATDLASLIIIAHVAARFDFISRRADTVAITQEFGRVLWEEVSYIHEAQNAERFARMFQNNLGVYIPMVYKQFSTDRVITMEDVSTIKINDYEALENAGVNRTEVSKRLMTTYLQQIFEDRFFHADPHPGNLFVYPLPVEPGTKFGPEGRPFYLIFVDFGMTGWLTQQIVDGLISTLVAVVTRDAGRLIESYQELDLLLPGADLERLEEATKATFDQVWGLSMTELSTMDYETMEALGNEFNDLLFDMPFQMPQNFIYLGRTIGILSGMTTSLAPNFNPWQELQPYTQQMMRQEAKQNRARGNTDLGTSLLTNILGGNSAAAIIEAGQAIVSRTIAPGPSSNDALARQLRSGDVKVTVEPSRKLQIHMQLLELQGKNATRAVVFSGLLVSSTIFVASGMAIPGTIGFVLTGMVGWRVLFPPTGIK